MRVEVDPRRVRFTQDSIASHFQGLNEKASIHDAVTNIVKGVWCADTFPPIRVLRHEGVLWSLDNRRLWVFREAGLNIISVNLDVKFASHDRFQELVKNPSTMQTFKSDTFKPYVRGKKKKKNKPQTPVYSRSPTLPATKPAITPDSRLLKHSLSTSAALGWGHPQIPNAQSCYGSRSSDEHMFGQNKFFSTLQPNSESSLRAPLLPKYAGSNYCSSSSSVQQPRLLPAPPSSRPGRENSSPSTISKNKKVEASEYRAPQETGFLSLLCSWCCMLCVD